LLWSKYIKQVEASIGGKSKFATMNVQKKTQNVP
jgi:hypothetical protein